MNIYHYTTIEVLALILANKTIKFSRLDKVDDLDEGRITHDGTPLSHIFFASCWSAESEESIAMWKLYTKDGIGVRIGLDSATIFDDQIEALVKEPDINKINATLGNKDYFDTLIIRQNYVEYVSDPMSVIQKGIRPYNDATNSIHIDNTVIGYTKDKSWEFQQEYRFLKMILPKDHNTTCLMPGKTFDTGWSETYNLLKAGKGPESAPGIPLEYDLVPLGKNALNSLNIVLGPNCKEEHKLIVESLCEKFKIKAVIRPSKLTGRVRFKS